MTLDAPAQRPYGHAELGSHYQGQVAATESRYGGAAELPVADNRDEHAADWRRDEHRGEDRRGADGAGGPARR